ncbi:hypothetical protein [Sphingomonas sp.]|uniref:hypothetical protein n=1 Tax=Sphingomonas sp. TaxID=28214 RepID=UPI0025DEECE2|nr:hypothetical protein [Sphingomonas sp.]
MKDSVQSIERRAAKVLEAFLSSIPGLAIKQLEREPDLAQADRPDLVATLSYAGKPLVLVVEVKGSGQPKIVREAARQAKRAIAHAGSNAVPMIMAPYLSEQAQDVCRDEQVAFLDFMGNSRVSFGTVYVERRVEGRPEPERRALRSLFKPKSARILRAMLHMPDRHWRVVELAHDVEVSLGLVSTVGKALRERDWADQDEEGLYLTDPDRLLDAWAQDYEPPRGEEVRLYTHLHGKQLVEKLKGLTPGDGRVALASYSAAEWLAPYARPSRYPPRRAAPTWLFGCLTTAAFCATRSGLPTVWSRRAPSRLTWTCCMPASVARRRRSICAKSSCSGGRDRRAAIGQ